MKLPLFVGRRFYSILPAADRVGDGLDKYGEADRIPAPVSTRRRNRRSREAIARTLDALQEKRARRS